MKAYMESRDINPLIHNIVTRWSSLVRLMLWPLYSNSNSHLYVLNKIGWVVPESIWMFKRREKFLTPATKQNFNHLSHSAVTILTLKIANTLITLYLAAALNKTKLHYSSKK
jgi:hypothetical protein